MQTAVWNRYGNYPYMYRYTEHDIVLEIVQDCKDFPALHDGELLTVNTFTPTRIFRVKVLNYPWKSVVRVTWCVERPISTSNDIKRVPWAHWKLKKHSTILLTTWGLWYSCLFSSLYGACLVQWTKFELMRKTISTIVAINGVPKLEVSWNCYR